MAKQGLFLAKEYIRWRLQNISSNARKVEEILWSYLNYASGTSMPAQVTMAKGFHMSRTSVIKGLKELEDKKIIQQIKKKIKYDLCYSHNEYVLLNYVDAKVVIPNPKITDTQIDNLISDFLQKRE